MSHFIYLCEKYIWQTMSMRNYGLAIGWLEQARRWLRQIYRRHTKSNNNNINNNDFIYSIYSAINRKLIHIKDCGLILMRMIPQRECEWNPFFYSTFLLLFFVHNAARRTSRRNWPFCGVLTRSKRDWIPGENGRRERVRGWGLVVYSTDYNSQVK